MQPYGEKGVTGQSLTCDLQTGKLTLADAIDKIQKGYTTAYGIMGIIRLRTGCVLMAVTGARKVNSVCLAATSFHCVLSCVVDTAVQGQFSCCCSVIPLPP